MPNDQPIDLNDEFFSLWVLIAQTKDALLAAREREYYQYQIKNERRAVILSIIALGGQATTVEIARFLFRKLNSVSEMLKRMEEQGLIEKVISPGSSQAIIKLTPEGYTAYEQSFNNVTDRRILSVLSKKQRKNLASYLMKIRNEAARELGIQPFSLIYSPDFNNHKQYPKKK
jgi:DNA-binding MarR family transcriptional regulator